MLINALFSASLLTFKDFEAVPLYIAVITGFFVIVLAVIYLLNSWFLARRRVLKHQITAEFRPPLDLNPAEIGYVFRGKVGQRDFAGLLVHMAQRGVIHFRKHKGRKIVLPGPKYVNNLKYYEKQILKTVTEGRNVTSENLTNYNHTIFRSDPVHKTLSSQVMHTLIAKKFHSKSPQRNFTRSVLIDTFVIIVLLVWLSLGALMTYKAFSSGSSDIGSITSLGYSIAIYSAIAFFPVAGFIAVLRPVIAKVSGRKWVAQARFKKFWPHIIGFRQYVVLSEHGKLHFEEESLRKKSSINTLPYAIALGQVDNWRDIVF